MTPHGGEPTCTTWTAPLAAAPRIRRAAAGWLVEAAGSPATGGGLVLAYPGLEAGSWYTFSVRAALDDLPAPAENVSVEVLLPDESRPGARPLDWCFAATQDHGDERTYTARFHLPEGAGTAQVRLLLRWTDRGRVTFSDWQLAAAEAPAPRRCRVAVVAGLPAQPTVEQNVAQWTRAAADAAQQHQAQLVLLPEVVVQVGCTEPLNDTAQPVPGPATAAFQQVARDTGALVATSLFERDGDAVYNTGVVVGPEGLLHRYRKAHLSVNERWDGLAVGQELNVSPAPLGRVGMQICYDIVHPEGCRALACRGAELILLPIMGDPRCATRATTWDADIWYRILSLRAMDHHVWLLVARNAGPGSCLVRPDGEVVARLAEAGGSIGAEVDLGFRHRSWIGSDFADRYRHERRPSLYGVVAEG